MSDFIQKLLEAPLSTILVIAGLFFVFIGFGGEFSEKIITAKVPKIYAVIFGVVLIAVGVLMYSLRAQKDSSISHTPTISQIDVSNQVEKVTFYGGRENSGSIFEELKTGTRQRFGSQDTKHNDTCWVGRRSEYAISVAFLDVHMLLPGVLLDRIKVKKATFLVEEFAEVEENEITRWLGPLMVLALDYGELDISDADNVLDKGQTIRSYENIYDLYKPTDITAEVQKHFTQRKEHLRLVFIFPGRGEDHKSPGLIQFEPSKVKVLLEYQEVK